MTNEKDEVPFGIKVIGILLFLVLAFYMLKKFAADDSLHRDSSEIISSSLKIEVASKTEENLLGGTRHLLQITSKDENSFTLNKVVLNRRVTENCIINFSSEKTDKENSMKKRTYFLGDVEKIYLPKACGEEIVIVDVYTDRGEFSYHFET